MCRASTPRTSSVSVSSPTPPSSCRRHRSTSSTQGEPLDLDGHSQRRRFNNRTGVDGCLGDHLACQVIEKVTVQSTSDHVWIWFCLLEAFGLDVQLVTPAT